MRLDPGLFSGEMEAWRTVYSIAIEQRHRRHDRRLEVRAHRDQFLGNRSPFEEADRGAGMKFNVHQVALATHVESFVISSEAGVPQIAARCRSPSPLGMTNQESRCSCS